MATVRYKLDNYYITQRGCTAKLAVNRPEDYLCKNPSTGKTDERPAPAAGGCPI